MRRGGLRKAAASRALLNYQQRRGEERRSASPEKTRPEGRADWGRTVVWLSRPNRWRPPARPTHAPASARPGRQPKGRGRVGLERQGRGAAGERVGLTAPRWLAAGSSSGFRAAAAAEPKPVGEASLPQLRPHTPSCAGTSLLPCSHCSVIPCRGTTTVDGAGFGIDRPAELSKEGESPLGKRAKE